MAQPLVKHERISANRTEGVHVAEPVNPYAAPSVTDAADLPALVARSRIARRTRRFVRLLGSFWLVTGVWLMADPLSIFTHTYVADELVGLLSFLLCLCGGIVLAFRWRWAIWSRTGLATIAAPYSAFLLRHVLKDYDVMPLGDAALRTALQWVVLFPLSAIGGAWTLWGIRCAQLSGVAYRWNPDESSGAYEYEGRPADAALVQTYSRRWNRLGWSWIVLGCAVAALVFPCLLLLKEESQRVTAPQWTAAAVVQVIAACLGAGLVALGIAIRRRNGRAARYGLLAAYILLAANVANLALPVSLFPDFVDKFADMAFAVYIALGGVGLLMAVFTHFALWSARKIERSGLPVSTRFEQLTRCKSTTTVE
jgi:hypothetical protein